jgi:2-hydroxychromene-2-carboxylate isomerase
MTASNDPTRNEQQPGLASRQDAPALAREIQRRVLLVVPRLRRIDQSRREFMRRISGAPHRIDFFHQVDDPYSALAIQAIAELRDRYDVEFRFHLVSQTDRIHAPEPELLADYARRDCVWIAPHYRLDFPRDSTRPSAESVHRVERLLAGLTKDPRFLQVATEAGRAIWQDDSAALDSLAERIPMHSEADTQSCLEAGNALRTKRRHYSGGMFWYAGEWYWGVDRLHHLERRLIRLGASKAGSASEHLPRFDRPSLDPGEIRNDGSLKLEIFPSLRSPYTAFIFSRSMSLAKEVDVPVTIRPVMPMVMRGVPAPAAKGFYIMMDAIREAEVIGEPFGNMLDPIGRPVERGFSLWPFANERGRGAEFLAEFLRAAFVLGEPTGTDAALQRIVERAGLSFEEARAHLDSEQWREELEANRRLMYEELGLWGVPSYRLHGPEGEPDLCVWGQDRLWLVAAEIRRRLSGQSLDENDTRLAQRDTIE